MNAMPDSRSMASNAAAVFGGALVVYVIRNGIRVAQGEPLDTITPWEFMGALAGAFWASDLNARRMGAR